MSQASHNSDSGSTPKHGTRNGGRDWLGRSRSQPRLPLHSQDSHVSIRSDHSSVDDRVRSPPNSAQKVWHVLLVLTCSIVVRRHTGGHRPRGRSIPSHTTQVRLLGSQAHCLTQSSERKIPKVMHTSMKNFKSTRSSSPVLRGQRRGSSRANVISIRITKSPKPKVGRKVLPS